MLDSWIVSDGITISQDNSYFQKETCETGTITDYIIVISKIKRVTS